MNVRERTQFAASIGLDAGAMSALTLLRKRPFHTIYRLKYQGKWRVLKWFNTPKQSVELFMYRWLHENGVPTLPVHYTSDQAILLEDLEHSSRWKLAVASDMQLAEVGTAVAHWYLTFHDVGYGAMLANEFEGVLTDWVHCLTPESLQMVGQKFGIEQVAGWQLGMKHIERLKAAQRCFPQTILYHDFYHGNCALSRHNEHRLQAIVFDYDQVCIGPRYTDWRNVTSSLQGAAKEAFTATYRPVNPLAARLDAPLCILHSLTVAAQRKQFPNWAKSSIEQVNAGELELSIRHAINAVA